ncbi:MAG: VTT domain-containing protein [Eubacteriales bacterium]
MDSKIKAKFNRYVAILKLFVLFGIIIGLSITITIFAPDFASIFQDTNKAKAFLLQYKAASILVFILLQIVQIVVAILPGQVLQFVAGYVYSFGFGVFWSMVGIMLGTIITFYLAKLLGKDAMHIIFGEERITKFVNILNSKKAYTVIFVIFLIPGIPKDLISYAAGISEIGIKPLLVLSLVGRFPALVATIAMSRLLYNGSYIALGIFIFAIIVLFILGIWKRRHITEYMDKAYTKLSNWSY